MNLQEASSPNVASKPKLILLAMLFVMENVLETTSLGKKPVAKARAFNTVSELIFRDIYP